jgi:hypothetical protein
MLHALLLAGSLVATLGSLVAAARHRGGGGREVPVRVRRR